MKASRIKSRQSRRNAPVRVSRFQPFVNFSLFFILVLAACSAPAPGEPKQNIPPAITQLPTETTGIDASPATATPQPPAPAGTAPVEPPEETSLQNTRYNLSATLDYARHHLQVEEHIQYTNRSPDPLPELRLMVEPAFYPGVFQLKDITWEDGQEVETMEWEGAQLKLPLRQPLLSGQTIGLALSYELNLPSPVPSAQTRPVPFGYSQRQTNLVDWYPFIPPYIPGKGWLAHQPGYFGEHLAYEVADFQVEIRLAEPSYGGQPLTIAASAPAQKEGDVYRYSLETARNFVWSVSHDYQVLTAKAGPVTVYGYAFPMHALAGEAVLETTVQALELYSRLFGPYPRQTLTVVEADFLDGMEYDGLYFLSNGFYNLYQGTPGEYIIAIAAHETAHQWWYGQVGNDQALEPWLDEALCTYSERVFYEHLYPDALDWWWAYRVKYYEPHGWVDGSIYNPEGYRAYRDAVYLNGALFLEELRLEIGEDVFFAFLRDYTMKHTNRLATGMDFFATLRQHTTADLSNLLVKYFQSMDQ